ncbi:MAG: response regulator [Microcystaceae cyanobacterium]
MQGTLNEIDIRSILQLIELGQRTGELFVESYGSGSPLAESGENGAKCCWFVFFVNGQIVYAADRTYGQLKRLRDYLHRFKLKEKVELTGSSALETANAPEYAYLWMLLGKNILTPVQARITVQNMVQEILFDLLSLRQGTFTFEMGTALDPPLTSFEISPLLFQMTKQLQEWKRFHPWVRSPDQILAIADEPRLKTTLSNNLYQQLMIWAGNKTSLRQLSRYLHRDLPTVAKGFLPYIERGLLTLEEFSYLSTKVKQPSPWDTYPASCQTQLVYIDDDRTIGQLVEQILGDRGYTVALLSNPLEALSQVFHLQPSLIFCDITMPQLDGYEICAMLRHSTAFRQTPIIMLTGKDAFMDRVRARMVGATDYLTKPFGEGELLLLLESYLPAATFCS